MWSWRDQSIRGSDNGNAPFKKLVASIEINAPHGAFELKGLAVSWNVIDVRSGWSLGYRSLHLEIDVTFTKTLEIVNDVMIIMRV